MHFLFKDRNNTHIVFHQLVFNSSNKSTTFFIKIILHWLISSLSLYQPLFLNPQSPQQNQSPPSFNFYLQESRRESEVITRDITEYFNKTNNNSQRVKLKYSPPPANPTTTTTKLAKIREDDHRTIVRNNNNSNNSGSSNGSATGNRYQLLKMFGGGLKLKERLVLGASIAAVLFTFLLVIDLQMDLGMTGQHVIPSHGRVRYVSQEDGPGEAYNSFRKRFLQKTRR